MPMDYGWTGEAPPRQQSPQGQRTPTLAGTLNALGAGGDTAPTGLVIPGAQNAPAPADPGVVDFNRLGRLGVSGVGAALSLPRLMAWNAGPALVGRPGEGPQTGTDLLGRLGMNPESGLTHALGFGAETIADPLMFAGRLSGLGRLAPARAAAPAVDGAATLAGRLERFAGSGLQQTTENSAARLGSLADTIAAAPTPYQSYLTQRAPVMDSVAAQMGGRRMAGATASASVDPGLVVPRKPIATSPTYSTPANTPMMDPRNPASPIYRDPASTVPAGRLGGQAAVNTATTPPPEQANRLEERLNRLVGR